MALGKIKADTLEHSTAGSLDTKYVVNGSNKARAVIDTAVSVTAISNSMNVSSVADNGSGDFTLAWTTSMNATPYAFSQGTYNNGGDAFVRALHVRASGGSESTPSGMTTNNCRFLSAYAGASQAAANGYNPYSCINIQGDLA